MPEYEANPAEGLIGVASSVSTSTPGSPHPVPTFQPAGGEPNVEPTAKPFDETTEPFESVASSGRFLSMKNRYILSAIVSAAILVGVVLIKQNRVKPPPLAVAAADDASKDQQNNEQTTDKNASDEKASDIDKNNIPTASNPTANASGSAKASERDSAIAPNSEEPVVIAANDEAQASPPPQAPSDPRPDPAAIPVSIDESKPGEKSTAANEQNGAGAATPTDPAHPKEDPKIAEAAPKDAQKNPQDKPSEPPAAPNSENAQTNAQTSASSSTSSVDSKRGADTPPSKPNDSSASPADKSSVTANETPVVAPPSADPIAPAPVPAGSSGPLPAPPPPASNESTPATAPLPTTIESPNASTPDPKPVAPPLDQNPVEPARVPPNPAVQPANARENQKPDDVNTSNLGAPPTAEKIDPAPPNPAAGDRRSTNVGVNDPPRSRPSEPAPDFNRAEALNHEPARTPPVQSGDAPSMNSGDWIPIPNATNRRDSLATNGGEFGSSGSNTSASSASSSNSIESSPSSPPAAMIDPRMTNQPNGAASANESTVESIDYNGESREPIRHVVEKGENFWTISRLYYDSGRYYKALWAANRDRVSAIDQLYVGTTLRIPPPEALDPKLIEPPAGLAPLPERSDRTAGTKKVGSTRNASARVGSIDRSGSYRSDDQDEPNERSGDATEIRSTVRRPKRRVSFEDMPEGPITQKYVVKRYDTIRSIARDMLGDSGRAKEIIDMNKNLIDDPYDLPVGEVILLPEDARPRRILR